MCKVVRIMDEKNFKRHLRDLMHGKHDLSEHDWSPESHGHKTDQRLETHRSKAKRRKK
jgi:hypothetical protein